MEFIVLAQRKKTTDQRYSVNDNLSDAFCSADEFIQEGYEIEAITKARVYDYSYKDSYDALRELLEKYGSYEEFNENETDEEALFYIKKNKLNEYIKEYYEYL